MSTPITKAQNKTTIRRVALGADHRGSEALHQIAQMLRQQAIDTVMCVDRGGTACDYPDMAFPVCRSIVDGEADLGILACGTGLGSSIAANKVPGIRAALVHDEIGAEMSRRCLDANVLCLAADMTGARLLERIVAMFLGTTFEGGRHERRLAKVRAIEGGGSPEEVETVADTADPGGA
ncbi:MAG: RpiB/LacA/LacB family sugar-phosphate isomerase [Planctomycetota bacterium]